MIASACWSRCCNRVFSRSSSCTRRASGCGGAPRRPRFFGASPANAPCSRCRRHSVRCEEYNPSRRSRAPISPGTAQTSASRRMRTLYSAVNRRRWGFSATSGSGRVAAANSAPVISAPCRRSPEFPFRVAAWAGPLVVMGFISSPSPPVLSLQ